jgi:hypothetical protein
VGAALSAFAMEGAAEASAAGDAGAIGVAATGDRSVSSAAGYAAETIASPAAVVVAVGDEDWEEAAVAIGSLLYPLLIGGEIGAEAVVDDMVVLVDAALHLGLSAAGEHGEGGCS